MRQTKSFVISFIIIVISFSQKAMQCDFIFHKNTKNTFFPLIYNIMHLIMWKTYFVYHFIERVSLKNMSPMYTLFVYKNRLEFRFFNPEISFRELTPETHKVFYFDYPYVNLI